MPGACSLLLKSGVVFLVKSFSEKLKEGVVLFDGAMGTMLYKKGAYINQCYEGLNLTAPKMVSDIYAAYVQAGADVIKTNTYGANGNKLKGFGLEAKVREINMRAVEMAKEAAQDAALVAGSVGPLGAHLKPLGPLGGEQAKALYQAQIGSLIEAGVDLIVFESFSDSQELKLAVEITRSISDLPIIAQGSFNEKGETAIGTTLDIFLKAADKLDVDVIGFNCSTGPADMISLLEKAQTITKKPISCMPNAGMPKVVDGRYFYLASIEYMAEYAKRFIQTGARVVGGCCGTAPKHIKAMHSAIRALFPGKRNVEVVLTETEQAAVEEVPQADKSRLGQALHTGKFITTIEITPPRSADPTDTIAKCRLLEANGIDAVNIPDGPRASARLSPMVLAMLIEQQVGIEAILHYTCRDRNIIGMQSDLLGLHAAGIRNLLIITGDPPKVGDYPDATAVFDVDSIGLTKIVTGLNQARDVGGNPIPKPLAFLKGVGVNPGAINLDEEIERLHQKIAAGAEFMITQPVFDPDIFFRFRDRIKDVTLPIVAGIWPLMSFKNAEFMNNEVPGATVPPVIMERMRAKGSGRDAQQEGVKIAGEALVKIKKHIQGVQVSAPFGKADLAVQVLKLGGVQTEEEKYANE
ncbi:bifunctional homocysteine S-methyltransferase/methylenetetrahydrofolate reductase [bacterium]|nr:bifunctional homocysteine S-methyltransferase/methylenetetrahydrofolate reductase [bacterium]